MADDDKEPAPPPHPRQQPPVWVPEQVWDTPPLRRNNVLYEPQPNFVPSPMEPPPPRADTRVDNEVTLPGVAATGVAGGIGIASGVGSSVASAVGSSSDTARRIDARGGAFKINGEAADIAHFVGHVPSRRTVIVRTVLNNQVAVRFTGLSLLAALDLKIEALRAGGSNSEITEFDDLKRRVEEFLAANEKAEETAIADATLSIADGLRRYWTEKYENVCDIGLLGVGLSFCAAAGALGVSDTNILAVTALAGGNRVVDVVKAAADLVWGKRDKN